MLPLRGSTLLSAVLFGCLTLAPVTALAQVDWHGFLEAGYGLRTTDDARVGEGGDYTLQETRAQLRLSSYGDRGEVFLRLDMLHDEVADDETELRMREGYLRFPLFGDRLEVKAGRQALTCGTGDLIFINDLFPKDWVSFFIGREDQYLKAPVDAIRFGVFNLPVNVDIALSPEFTPDNLPSGVRLSYFAPEVALGPMGRPLPPGEPAGDLDNGEIGLRLSRYIGSLNVSAYGYHGFFKTPQGLESVAVGDGTFMRPFYPELRVYGASARGSGLGGILWGELGYYDSLQDQDGVDPLIPNSSLRFLGGVERQIATDFNLGFQYYGEWMKDHEEYLDGLSEGAYEQSELRQLLTLRVEKLLRYQTIRLSLFTFYSPTDEDSYARALASYRVSDEVEVALGGNLFVGENESTQFGQFDKNDNFYARLRYNF